jgi:Zn-dependent M28 family amino/carboxypeptidase
LRLVRRLALFAVMAVLLLGSIVCVTVQPAGSGTRAGPVVHADPELLQASVRELASKPRGWQNVERLDGLAEWLKAQLPNPTEQTWEVKGHTYRNISALFGPNTGPRVVVGAHYDSADGLPGADDNASGVAATLELARLFAEHPPAGQVELVFWSLEEPPWFREPEMGSAHHADALAAAKVDVRAVLSLETIGYYSDAEGSQHFPSPLLGLVYPTTGNYIAVVGDLGQVSLVRTVKDAMRGASDLRVESINAPSLIPGIDWSDHRSYWAHGWPAVMVTDTAPNRNANYHEGSDKPETLDYARMAKVVEGVHSAICALTAPR